PPVRHRARTRALRTGRGRLCRPAPGREGDRRGPRAALTAVAQSSVLFPVCTQRVVGSGRPSGERLAQRVQRRQWTGGGQAPIYRGGGRPTPGWPEGAP